jgi:DNA (cytosine-5)-methyltransferase 1
MTQRLLASNSEAPKDLGDQGKSSMKSVELFAGAGGLGLGLHSAGFSPVRVVEWNRDCCETIRFNRDSGHQQVATWNLTEGDVRKVKYDGLEGNVDLVSGGPPCQPFSLGGKHQAIDDSRDMFPQAIRAVRDIKPRAFVFENVKGLTRATFSNYFEYIRLQLEHPDLCAKEGEDWAEHLARLEKHHTKGRRDGLSYQVVARVLNAADYGVPQRRERVIFVGFRDDLRIEWSFPDETHSIDALVWQQVNSETYWEERGVPIHERGVSDRFKKRAQKLKEKPEQLPWKTVRDALNGLPDPEREKKKHTSVSNHSYQPGARSYKGHTGSPLDEPAKTLKAGVHGVPGGENMLLRPDGSVRYFSVRESARLQTFPDDYYFTGCWSEAMRQIGNAVPVDLSRIVGQCVAQRLEDEVA